MLLKCNYLSGKPMGACTLDAFLLRQTNLKFDSESSFEFLGLES